MKPFYCPDMEDSEVIFSANSTCLVRNMAELHCFEAPRLSPNSGRTVGRCSCHDGLTYSTTACHTTCKTHPDYTRCCKRLRSSARIPGVSIESSRSHVEFPPGKTGSSRLDVSLRCFSCIITWSADGLLYGYMSGQCVSHNSSKTLSSEYPRKPLLYEQ